MAQGVGRIYGADGIAEHGAAEENSIRGWDGLAWLGMNGRTREL